jgi:sugar phosphate permease
MNAKFPQRYRVLVLLFFLLSITYLDRTSISLVGIHIMSEFHLSKTQFGLVASAFSLAYAIFEIPSGWLGDKLGQKAALIRIVLWWSIFTALTGVVTGFISLIIIRFFFGMGEAGAFPNTTGVISRWFPANELSRGVSIPFAGQATGLALAPLIIIPVEIAFGWRATFFVNGLIGLLWVMVCWWWFKNNPSEMKRISSDERRLIEENRKFSTHDSKIPWKQMLKNRTLLAICFVHFCSQWSNYFIITWLPIFLREGRHFSQNAMKYAVTFVLLPAIPLSFFFGILGDRIIRQKGLTFGRRFVSGISLTIIAVSLLMIATFSNNSVLIIGLATVYIFQSFYATAAFGVCIDISNNHPGTVTGVMNTCGQIGAFFMVMIFGWIVDISHNYNAPLYVIAGILFFGSMACLVLEPTRKLIFEDHKVSLEDVVAA